MCNQNSVYRVACRHLPYMFRACFFLVAGSTPSLVLCLLFMLAGNMGNGTAELSARAQLDPNHFLHRARGRKSHTPVEASRLPSIGNLRRSSESPYASFGGTCDATPVTEAKQFECSSILAPSMEFCENPLFGGERICCYDTYGIQGHAGLCRRCQRSIQSCLQAREICTKRCVWIFSTCYIYCLCLGCVVIGPADASNTY